jgi:hypothetical protein
MKIGDLLLLKGVINKKQLQKALRKQSEQAINYDRAVPLGKILIEMKFVTVDDLSEILNEQSEGKKEKNVKAEEKVMPTEIGEGSKFTFDLKFIATMGMILVSACTIYFSITGQLNELEANNSPNRLEYEYLKGEVDIMKSTGDLKLITYQLEEFKDTFAEIKSLSSTLTPLASDLKYIKSELGKLTNSMNMFEERLVKLESKKEKSGGRF